MPHFQTFIFSRIPTEKSVCVRSCNPKSVTKIKVLKVHGKEANSHKKHKEFHAHNICIHSCSAWDVVAFNRRCSFAHAQPEKHIYTLWRMPISPYYNNTLTPSGSCINFADLSAPDVAQVLPKRQHDLYFIYTFHVVSLDSFTPFQPIVESLIVTPSFYLATVPTTKKHLSPWSFSSLINFIPWFPGISYADILLPGEYNTSYHPLILLPVAFGFRLSSSGWLRIVVRFNGL